MKAVVNTHVVLAGGDLTTPLTSDIIDMLEYDVTAMQFLITGNSTASWFREASFDQIHWYPVQGPNPLDPPGAGYLQENTQAPSPYYRIRFTPNTGSGTVSVLIFKKRIGD